MVQRMNASELAKDVPEAESMLQIHHERKVLKCICMWVFKMHSNRYSVNVPSQYCEIAWICN